MKPTFYCDGWFFLYLGLMIIQGEVNSGVTKATMEGPFKTLKSCEDGQKEVLKRFQGMALTLPCHQPHSRLTVLPTKSDKD